MGTSSTHYTYYNPDMSSVQDYYPGGMRMDLRNSQVADSAYRFGFNGQMRDDDIAGVGNHNTALFWEYDTRLGRRWNIDPVVKPWRSPYDAFSNNPLWKVDPNGADDYYNYSGKYVGTDGKGNAIRLIASQDAFDYYLKKGGLSELRKNTDLVDVQSNEDVNKTLTFLHTESMKGDGVERKAYFVLDVAKKKLFVEVQPIDEELDDAHNSSNLFYPRTRQGERFIVTSEDNDNTIIVGQIHVHTGLSNNGLTFGSNKASGNDQNDARNLGVPFYVIPPSGSGADIQKVTPTRSGNGTVDANKTNLLIDALQYSGEKEKRSQKQKR